MSKRDLPAEVSGLPLAYGQLIPTLDAVQGEPVIVRLSSREDDDGSTVGIASIVGELKREIPTRALHIIVQDGDSTAP